MSWSAPCSDSGSVLLPNVTHHQRRLSIRQRRLVHAVLGADARQKRHRQRVFGTRVGRHQVREAGHIIQKQGQPQGTPPSTQPMRRYGSPSKMRVG